MLPLLLVAALFAGTPKGMAPLPAEYLKDGTFNSPDGWFAVHVPPDCEWFEMRAFDGDADPRWPNDEHHVVAWFIRGPKLPQNVLLMERYAAVNAPELDVAYVDELEENIRKTATNGDSISEFFAEQIAAPVEGIHYHFKRTKADGSVRYEFWYVTGWQHKVFIEMSASTHEEPRQLRGIVQSFRWLMMP